MRIAIDISQLVYEGTGVATYVRETTRSLLSIDKENEYVLFGMSLRRLDLLKNYFQEIKNLNSKATLKLFPIPQLIGNLVWNKLHFVGIDSLLGKVDIFHSSDWLEPPVKAKKVTTVHDLVIYKYPHYSHPYIIETQKKRLYWVKKESTMVIADSLATKNDLIEILHFDPSRIEVIYPGLNHEFVGQNEEEVLRVRQKYNLSGNFILTVSAQEPRKNLKTLIEAFEKFSTHPLVKSQKLPVELVIVGKMGWGEGIKPVPHLRVLGFVDQNDLPALYTAASLFVYPSIYEGFGFPVLEAMACGCPVITSDRGSLKEIASDCALLIDPMDDQDMAVKMTQIFIDRELREQYKKKAKLHAAKFSWIETAKRIKEVYESL